MLVTQALNAERHPVYGCYVKGSFWYFLTLHERSYAISAPFVATRDDLFLLFGILKRLKQMVRELVLPQVAENLP